MSQYHDDEISRPLSDLELMPKMQQLYHRIEDELDVMKALGQKRAHARDDLNRARAHFWLIAKQEHPDLKSDKMREAWVIDQTEVADLMLACDLAETIYDDQRATVRALQSNVDLLRSMVASAREFAK